ncbi:MAG: thymidylate synthase [bacterium]
MTTFDRLYIDLLGRIFQSGIEDLNERTGHLTKVIPGVQYEIEPSLGFPLLTLRKIPLKIFIAEVIWMISGEKKVDFIRQFTKIWDEFTESDGTMETAYGYRWRRHFGRDQLQSLIDHLRAEPSSRQGVVLMWDPASDGLNSPKKKNVPCPFAWTANILGGKLNLHLIIRSNDMMLGNPHDVAGFALLQALLAQELGVGVGKYTVSISHAHIYDNHFPQVEELLARGDHEHPEVICKLPERSFERALQADPTLVEELFQNFKSQYNPLPPVEKMQIAV